MHLQGSNFKDKLIKQYKNNRSPSARRSHMSSIWGRINWGKPSLTKYGEDASNLLPGDSVRQLSPHEACPSNMKLTEVRYYKLADHEAFWMWLPLLTLRQERGNIRSMILRQLMESTARTTIDSWMQRNTSHGESMWGLAMNAQGRSRSHKSFSPHAEGRMYCMGLECKATLFLHVQGSFTNTVTVHSSLPRPACLNKNSGRLGQQGKHYAPA